MDGQSGKLSRCQSKERRSAQLITAANRVCVEKGMVVRVVEHWTPVFSGMLSLRNEPANAATY